MTLFVIALLLPVIAAAAFGVWTMFRRNPRDRCRLLFGQIARHPSYHPLDMPKLLDAVEHEDVAYLRAYLREMGKP